MRFLGIKKCQNVTKKKLDLQRPDILKRFVKSNMPGYLLISKTSVVMRMRLFRQSTERDLLILSFVYAGKFALDGVAVLWNLDIYTFVLSVRGPGYFFSENLSN